MLILPAELRLQVYTHLVVSCLATGDATAMRGLLFSCREIYNELKVDCLPKVQHLIDIIYEWKAAHSEHLPLLLRSPSNYKFSHSLTKAVISIPWSTTWVPPYDKYPKVVSFQSAMAALTPLSELPWTELAMQVYTDPPELAATCLPRPALPFIMDCLCYRWPADRVRRYFPNLGRLVSLMNSAHWDGDAKIAAITLPGRLRKMTNREIGEVTATVVGKGDGEDKVWDVILDFDV